MRTFPIKDDTGHVFAFEIRAQLFGWRLAHRLRSFQGFPTCVLEDCGSDLQTCISGFKYQGHECVVWEPYGDSSRWWIGPDDKNAPHVPLDEIEHAMARF